MMRAAVFLASLFAGATAFSPQASPSSAVRSTKLQFGFLKDLGLEKPSWLPDFGGKDSEEKEPVAVADAEASDEEGDDAPSEEATP